MTTGTTGHVAALTTDSSCLEGDYCDVSVAKTKIIGSKDGPDGQEIPITAMSDDVEFGPVETGIRHDGDRAGLEQAADALLSDNGWRRVGAWSPASSAYYADVEPA